MSQAFFSADQWSTSVPVQQTVSFYDSFHKNGILAIIVAAFVSGISVAFSIVIAFTMIRHDSNRTTHIFAYSLSLLGANLVQSISSLLSVEWILRGKVFVGAYCDVQGGLKQGGNLASAWWSLIISLHLFNLLFLRRSSDQTSTWSEITKWGTTVLGWALPVVLVAIGPAVVAKPEKGPFFGLSGYCCWISSEYREALIYLEFMLEYTAMILALLLSIIVLLRVRGNLVEHDRGWYLRKVPTEEKWALTVTRDLVDHAMFLVAQVNVWYAVAYTLLMIPITIVRILDVTGSPVPFWAVVMANVIFNLNGLANVLLLLITRKVFPEAHGIPAGSSIKAVQGRPDPTYAQRFRDVRRNRPVDEHRSRPHLHSGHSPHMRSLRMRTPHVLHHRSPYSPHLHHHHSPHSSRSPKTPGSAKYPEAPYPATPRSSKSTSRTPDTGRSHRSARSPRSARTPKTSPLTPSRVRLPLSPATPIWRMPSEYYGSADRPSYQVPDKSHRRPPPIDVPPPETSSIRVHFPSPHSRGTPKTPRKTS